MRRYPRLSQLPCEECKQFVYQIPDAEPVEYETDDGTMKKMKRNEPPPCQSCPKGGPENDQLCRVNWTNTKLINLYHRLQAPGYDVPQHLRGDKLFADNYSRVQDIVAETEREQLADRVSHSILTVMLSR